jgi:hypothetical protein
MAPAIVARMSVRRAEMIMRDHPGPVRERIETLAGMAPSRRSERRRAVFGSGLVIVVAARTPTTDIPAARACR